MLEFIGIIVVVGTIIIAGNQRANETGKIIGIVFVGLSLLNLLATIKEVIY